MLTSPIAVSGTVTTAAPANQNVSGISLDVEGANRIKVSGIDRETVGEMAAKIRALRPPDAYKGKGIRYAGEVVHLKPGKAGKMVGKK